jgi:hypothetical protein
MIPHGRNTFLWQDDGLGPSRPVTVHTYRPSGTGPHSPLVVVQHGMLRNGDAYRDFWIPAADEHGMVVVAPTFPKDQFPEARDYNDGGVPDGAGGMTPASGWAYFVPARIVAAVRDHGVGHGPILLFGHSAGAQFVHRLVALAPGGPWSDVMAGNAGWYTLPDVEAPFPAGLGGTGADLHGWLGTKLTILAGDHDTATEGDNLPSQPAARAQGPHRYARAQNFLAVGRAAAAALDVPFGWRLVSVPGVGHDGETMSAVAAVLWRTGALPTHIENARGHVA